MRMNPTLGIFAIIALVTLFRCTEAGLLVGEDTPVWIARSSGGNVTFERLEKGAVKRAITYFKSDKFNSLRSIRRSRSIDDRAEFAEPHNYERLALQDVESLGSNRTRSKRNYGAMRDVSILALAQYDASEVTDDASREKFINEKILYVISYWGKFNQRIAESPRKKMKLKVHVCLVGIIIALDRGVTPYLNSNKYAKDMISPAVDYWHQPRAEFPFNSYHAVATMTDIRPWEEYHNAYDIGAGNNNLGNIVIVWDKRIFHGVLPNISPLIFRECVNWIFNWSLQRNVELPDYMNPGTSVISIQPGQLFSPMQQCVDRGYFTVGRVCSEYSTNCELWCRNAGVLRFCGNVGKALEGTPCVDGKV